MDRRQCREEWGEGSMYLQLKLLSQPNLNELLGQGIDVCNVYLPFLLEAGMF
jgi:hypothetical protein